MSHYTVLETQIADARLLAEALGDMGFLDVEVHREPQALYGYLGDRRAERAEVIVRRDYIGAGSNDIGFARQPDGSFQAIVSDFDRGTYDEAWIGRLTQRYAYRAARETLAAQDFDLVEEQVDQTGTIRCTVRRMA
jgi:hypothetical protein